MKKEVLTVYEQHLASLSDRVCKIEAKQVLHASKRYVFVGAVSPPLFYIQTFVSALFPDKGK